MFFIIMSSSPLKTTQWHMKLDAWTLIQIFQSSILPAILSRRCTDKYSVKAGLIVAQDRWGLSQGMAWRWDEPQHWVPNKDCPPFKKHSVQEMLELWINRFRRRQKYATKEKQTRTDEAEWMRCKSVVKANHYPVHSITALWQFLVSLQ